MGKFVLRFSAAFCALFFFVGHAYPAATPARITAPGREYPDQGLQWAARSAQQENLQAQERLAIEHYFGEGVPLDYVEAVKWVRLAVAGGSPLPREVYWNLGANRDGATKAREIIEGLRLGAAKGNPLAQELLGVEMYLGEAVPKDLEQAVKYLLLAAEKGLPRSQYFLGHMYTRGEGLPQNYILAIGWFEKAAVQGFPEAQHELGRMYAYGRGVQKNTDEAIRWLRLAAARKLAPAKNLLWTLIYTTASKNADKMKEWLQAEAMAGNADAQFEYGETLLRMQGAPRHLNEISFYQLASYWYQKAARQGLADAQYRLAQLNMHGQGGAVDCRAAFIWASLAKAQGHEEAGRLMEQCMNCLDPVQQADARKASARLQAQIGDQTGTAFSSPVSASKPGAEKPADRS
jgi:hypothetical protein